MTGGAQARKARTRERILNAAIDLFLENGFHGTNIDSVASRSHSSKQTIYKYYDDKEEILEHAITRLREELNGETFKLSFESSDFESELAEFGLSYLNAILRERQVQTFRLCVEVARRSANSTTLFGKVDSDKLHAVLSDYIAHLSAKGLIAHEHDAEFMAQAFLGMVRGNYHLSKTIDAAYAPSKRELRAHVTQVTRLFCAALSREPA